MKAAKGKETEEAPQHVEAINYSDVRREVRKETLGIDAFFSELDGKEILILKVDTANSVATVEVEGRMMKVGYRGIVISRQLEEVKRIIERYGKPVKVKVVRRQSRGGRAYVALQ